MTIPLNDPRNAMRLLAERLDELSGLVAVLMAHAAHTTGDDFERADFNVMKAKAEAMVPERLACSVAASPTLHASQNADLLWEMIGTVRSDRRPNRETGA